MRSFLVFSVLLTIDAFVPKFEPDEALTKIIAFALVAGFIMDVVGLFTKGE